jgi:hypothetical protein
LAIVIIARTRGSDELVAGDEAAPGAVEVGVVALADVDVVPWALASASLNDAFELVPVAAAGWAAALAATDDGAVAAAAPESDICCSIARI